MNRSPGVSPAGIGSALPETEPGASTRPELDAPADDPLDEGLALARAGRGSSVRGLDVLARYQSRSILGEGGMGEVRLVWDRLIGREVAMKVLLPSRVTSSTSRLRFLREAHVQGILEHPSVVPVHDIGELPSGEPFFTMKRIRGQTLLEILDALRAREPSAEDRFHRSRLLSAFGEACRAVTYAHSQGITHRDLKPENIMVADLGEVFVLDWGVSGVLESAASQSETLAMLRRTEPKILGTPGYMAPEQLDRRCSISPAVDVYALGAILFELLTLEPLHRGRDVSELIASTRRGIDVRARLRTHAIPGALEELCACALRTDSDTRPSASILLERLTDFLDGRRDAERNQSLFVRHLETAKAARAEARSGGKRAELAQRNAIRALSRAMAIDPDNPELLRTLIGVLGEPLETLPASAMATMRAEEDGHGRAVAGAMRLGRISWLLYAPMVAWMGVRDLPLGFALVSLIAAVALVSWGVDRLARPSPGARTLVALFGLLAAMPIAAIFSPVIALPAILAASVPAMSVHLDTRGRWLALITAVAVIAIPLGLEWTGFFAPSIVVRDNMISIRPRLVDFPSQATWFSLAVLSVAPVATCVMVMERVRQELDGARRRVHAHLWQLRQLLPRLDPDSITAPEAITTRKLAARAEPSGGTASNQRRQL